MLKYLIRCIAVLLALQTGHGVGADDKKDEDAKKTPFQSTAEAMIYDGIPGFVEFWHMPHFMSWGKCKAMYGTELPSPYREIFKRFPADLIDALRADAGVDQNSALLFLKMYVTWSRARAAHFGESDLSQATKLSLAPYTGKIKEALTAGLKAKSKQTRIRAAALLLCLDANEAKANEMLRAYETSEDEKLLEEAFYIIGAGQLTSPQAIDFLAHMLKHPNKSVREAAAGAAITMGTAARDLAPALVAFLETGKDAEGEYFYPFAIAMPARGNLALMALENLREYAMPALPLILKRFARANEDDQIAMLACLAQIGKQNDACLKIVRSALHSDKNKVILASACALLHLVPEDHGAVELLKQALAKEVSRDPALESIWRFAPPSRDLVKCLLPFLNQKNQGLRESTLRVLARIGPSATQAVPAIEKLFALKAEDIHWEPQVAVNALAAIRGKDAAAALLRIADARGDLARYAAAQFALVYLPELGGDLPPNAPALLIRAIEKDDKPKELANYFGSNKTFAAIALSNLGERARSVRRDMQRLVNDPEAGWILDTALRRLPPEVKADRQPR